MHEIVEVLMREGGKWMDIEPATVTDGELETAFANRYKIGSAGYVTKVPTIAVPFHAVKTVSGDIWDCVNTWRQ